MSLAHRIRRKVNSFQVIIVSFGLVILLGAFLLSLPVRPGSGAGWRRNPGAGGPRSSAGPWARRRCWAYPFSSSSGRAITPSFIFDSEEQR